MGIAVSNWAKIITFQKCCGIFNLEHVFKTESVAHYWFAAKSAKCLPKEPKKHYTVGKNCSVFRKWLFQNLCSSLSFLMPSEHQKSKISYFFIKSNWNGHIIVTFEQGCALPESFAAKKLIWAYVVKQKKIAFHWFCRKSAKGQHLELILECK